MKLTLVPLAFSALLLASGCPGDGTPTAPVSGSTSTGKVPNGTWGTDHLRLEVTAEGARLEFDCASATIDEPLAIDAAGKLDVRGKYSQGHGGPIHIGEENQSVPAHFTGTLKGDVLTLLIQTDGSREVGKYDLKMGSEGHVVRCL